MVPKHPRLRATEGRQGIKQTQVRNDYLLFPTEEGLRAENQLVQKSRFRSLIAKYSSSGCALRRQPNKLVCAQQREVKPDGDIQKS